MASPTLVWRRGRSTKLLWRHYCVCILCIKMNDDLDSMLRAAGLPAALSATFANEELTTALLRTMGRKNLLVNLSELGLTAYEAKRLADVLVSSRPSPRAHTAAEPAVPATKNGAVPLKPPSEPSPLVICADHGLCNRLRAVLSYREVAQREGRRLVVVWRRDMQCNGEFLDCFAPIAGVRFVREPPAFAPNPERVNHCHHAIIGTPAEVEGYGLLRPWPNVKALIDARVAALRPRFVAAHIRRTDMAIWAATEPQSRYATETTDACFDDFLQSFPHHWVYVATDCAATRARFAATTYAERMPAAAAPAQHEDPNRHRQTSLAEAVVELYVCVASDAFMGSYGSSFSNAIAHLRALAGGGDRAAADRHTLMHEGDWAGRGWCGPALREPRVGGSGAR